MTTLALPGTATPADILSGQTASSGAGFNFVGTMPAQGSPTFTPTPSAIAIPPGNYTGGTVAAAVLGAQGSLTVNGSTSYTINTGFAPSRVTFNYNAGNYFFDSSLSTTDIYNYDTSSLVAITYSTGTQSFTIDITGLASTISLTLNWMAIS